MKKKRLLMSSLAAALMITSAIGFTSCNKTTTENAAEEAEGIPTIYTFDDSMRIDNSVCPYCVEPLNLCDDWEWGYYNDPCRMGAYGPSNPLGHYHVHEFDGTGVGPTGDCRPQGQSADYFCRYKGVRAHRHVIVHTQNFFVNYWHTGGGGDGGAVIP